jgi:hypothetical protein
MCSDNPECGERGSFMPVGKIYAVKILHPAKVKKRTLDSVPEKFQVEVYPLKVL